MNRISLYGYLGIAGITAGGILLSVWLGEASVPMWFTLFIIGVATGMLWSIKQDNFSLEERAEGFRQIALLATREKMVLAEALKNPGKPVDLEPILDRLMADAEREVGP